MHEQLGQVLDNMLPKDQKAAPCEESGAKTECQEQAAYCVCSPYSTSSRGGQTTYATPQPDLWASRPSPHIRNSSPCPLRKQTRNLSLVFTPTAAAGAPVMSCLNFLTGLLSESTWRWPSENSFQRAKLDAFGTSVLHQRSESTSPW